MSAPEIRVSEQWLALREPADAVARARDLVEHLNGSSRSAGRWVIHDLGGGSGAMGRWLAPLLPGPQHWVVHDLDVDLLHFAIAHPPRSTADGAAITLEVRRTDVTRLQPGDLGGATLITASALLDLLSEEELPGLVTICAERGCPVLLALSVTGHVELIPRDPLDRRIAAAFGAHQRRMTHRGRLLGPDAAAAAVEQFGRLGAEVLVRPSAWRLRREQADLAAAWLSGWVAAACEQDIGLAATAEPYARRRIAQAAAGQLSVTVDHVDLLASPR
jgi:hypothetical protein